ncbi:hypothetical protein HYT17_00770 [Candidatus Microgenomates bacterium]|nr:hypothetical protein [Candidatus Microgenomates bacterium]
MSLFTVLQYLFIVILLMLFSYYIMVILAIRRAARTSKIAVPPVWKAIIIGTIIFMLISVAIILTTNG